MEAKRYLRAFFSYSIIDIVLDSGIIPSGIDILTAIKRCDDYRISSFLFDTYTKIKGMATEKRVEYHLYKEKPNVEGKYEKIVPKEPLLLDYNDYFLSYLKSKLLSLANHISLATKLKFSINPLFVIEE